jgi:hypothetical protein
MISIETEIISTGIERKFIVCRGLFGDVLVGSPYVIQEQAGTKRKGNSVGHSGAHKIDGRYRCSMKGTRCIIVSQNSP